VEDIFDAFEDKLKNPEGWVNRVELRDFLGMSGSKDKFNEYIKEIERLEDSYLYIQGTLQTNKTYNKVRIYNYINHINRLKERGA
jgi:hypothetical protein